MYEFTCGHQECGSQLTSLDKDILRGKIVDHLVEAHNAHKATQTVLSYLEATCVTSSPRR